MTAAARSAVTCAWPMTEVYELTAEWRTCSWRWLQTAHFGANAMLCAVVFTI